MVCQSFHIYDIYILQSDLWLNSFLFLSPVVRSSFCLLLCPSISSLLVCLHPQTEPSISTNFLSVWLVPFLFTRVTLPPSASFCLFGSPLPKCPWTTVRSAPSLLLRVALPWFWLCISPSSLFLYGVSLRQSVFLYSATAQMSGLICNSCLAMCHYQVLPTPQGRDWGGRGGGVWE